MLTSPVYAGMLVHGRRKLEMTPGNPPVMAERRRPVEEWDITVPDVYLAYLSYDQYLRNRQQLRGNMCNFAKKGRGAPRDGAALLQGLMLHPDHEVASRLDVEGLRTRTGKEWTYARMQSVRKQHGVSTGCLLDPDEAAAQTDGLVPSRTAADRLGVSASLVNLWVQHDVLVHDPRMAASKVWVRLNADDIARLTGTAADAAGLPTFASVRRQGGLSRQDLWRLVAAGRYLGIPHRTWADLAMASERRSRGRPGQATPLGSW